MRVLPPSRRYLIYIAIMFMTSLTILLVGYARLRNLAPCGSNVFVPTIEEFGKYRIVLGNGEILYIGEAYRFGDGPAQVRLLKVDEHGATFAYKYTSFQGEAGITTPFEETYQCRLFVAINDQNFQPRHDELALQPEDLADVGWTVDQYTEYVIPDTFYLVAPEDVVNLIVDTTRTRFQSDIFISYRIAIQVRAYETDTLATDALETERRAYYDHFRQVESGFEGCGLSNCGYLGQFDDHILIVSMSMLRETMLDANTIPLEDWHFILALVKTNLSGNVAAGAR